MRRDQVDQARRALDARFADLQPAARWASPKAGWIRAIRDALGMSGAALADRMGVTEPAVFALERTERQGTARLDTLRRAAAALDCTLVYAMIPNQELEQTVRQQAERIVDHRLARVRQTMTLEDQDVPMADQTREDLIEHAAGRRGLWSDL